jgi:hypothetical protein
MDDFPIQRKALFFVHPTYVKHMKYDNSTHSTKTSSTTASTTDDCIM